MEEETGNRTLGGLEDRYVTLLFQILYRQAYGVAHYSDSECDFLKLESMPAKVQRLITKHPFGGEARFAPVLGRQRRPPCLVAAAPSEVNAPKALHHQYYRDIAFAPPDAV